jgi:uncharacterized iron-regulated membrane protein
MTDRRLVAIVAVGLVVITLLVWWAKRPQRPMTAEEQRVATAAAEARAAEEAQTNQAFDNTLAALEQTKFLMKFNQFSSPLAHAEAHFNPAAWAGLTFEQKQKVGAALYHKAGNNPVYIIDGYSGKQLARQGPRGLDIE